MAGFDKIVGHEKVVEHLKHAIQTQKVSHAYILNGAHGMGKSLIADVFVQTLQCEEGGVEPCGHCKSCLQAESHNNPDIIYVTHEKDNSIGVDDIRDQLVNDIAIKPYSSRYKIYIVDEAEKMTVQAQNALLKTIEEPPAYGIIIFLTVNAESFLPTILSRCVLLNLHPVDSGKIERVLVTDYMVDAETAKVAAAFSQGRLGRAVHIATSEEYHELRAMAVNMLTKIDEMDLAALMEEVKYLADHKKNVEDFIDFCTLWFRDVLIYKSTSDANLVIYRENLSDIRKAAVSRSYDGLNRIIEAMDKAKIRLEANVNFDLTMQLLLMTIKEKDNG
ncbi:MAG: DNA polymerase III subunit delta [Lachnospiraceae bacterium]|nr:DNA polymerase III subunit delta [Lachnospiraceae bacterium]